VGACIVCHSETFRADGTVAWRDGQLSYVICERCGLKQLDPIPDWYGRYYADEFWTETGKDGKVRSEEARLKRAQDKARYHAEFVAPHLSAQSRALDVGCGYGFFGRLLHEATGCAVDGVEPGTIACEMAKQNGVKIVADDLRRVDARYDALLFASSFINLPDPAAALQASHLLLHEGGLLYIQINNPIYRGGEGAFHPFLFHQLGLAHFLRMHGFAPIRWDYEPFPPAQRPFRWWLTTLCRKAEPLTPDLFEFDLDAFRAARSEGQRLLAETYRDKSFIKQARERWPLA
jgi:SAM-dependent methyltransferase